MRAELTDRQTQGTGCRPSELGVTSLVEKKNSARTREQVG